VNVFSALDNQSTKFAISVAFPSRATGTLETKSVISLGVSIRRVNDVSMKPGATQLAMIPRELYSAERPTVSQSKANLLAE
jgi:hypothetical protein